MDDITDLLSALIETAETDLPKDVEEALEKARAGEEGVARTQLSAILENIACARSKKIPLCQDTGLLYFYVGFGKNRCMEAEEIIAAIPAAARKATEKVPLRPNSVDAFTRKNTGDNCGVGVPVVETYLIEGDYVEVTVFPKGAGSENMSALKMLNPSEGIEGIKKFVLESVASAGGKPCPPTIVGIGVGGTADYAMKLAKRALLRPVGKMNERGDVAKIEEELLEKINSLGVGPMGLGGRTTALSVAIEYASSHTASLPVAINMQCWANRRASIRLQDGKRI